MTAQALREEIQRAGRMGVSPGKGTTLPGTWSYSGCLYLYAVLQGPSRISLPPDLQEMPTNNVFIEEKSERKREVRKKRTQIRSELRNSNLRSNTQVPKRELSR